MPKVRVTVVYALPEKQYVHQLVLKKGSTVEEAIHASGLLLIRSDINLSVNKVGIFGRLTQLKDKLNDGDRVEIYRPLRISAKDLRRQHINHKKKK
ncbi:RnfH family protein [Sodalis sp. CWE]|uniref:RnfH family protein n=1 Tax=Sodalis sp. CWE TaxID=2803816 RepID=UPI001C7DC615|nr:RnfH family protein [Sodalis sp. CWE]MBX4181131.1 RnfH family protein [Sodalis sp. CWE]